MTRVRTLAAGMGLALASVIASAGPAWAGGTGSMPRFVSLKSDRVNLRTGPGTEYPTAWVFRRAGLPVEIIKEFEGWRQIRDAEGVTGWVLQSFLSNRRTSVVLPWELKPEAAPPQVNLRTDKSQSADTAAIVEAGVVASVHGCDGTWCDVSIDAIRGFIEQKNLWGVYASERW